MEGGWGDGKTSAVWAEVLKQAMAHGNGTRGGEGSGSVPAIETSTMCNYSDWSDYTNATTAEETDPQSGDGSKNVRPLGEGPVDSKNPLKSSNDEKYYTLKEFAEYNAGLSYAQIINQRPKTGGGAGGPILRYVLNPKDGNGRISNLAK